MSYKCRICGSNDVDNPGDICELCAIGQDPYAAGMSASSASSKRPHILNNNQEAKDTSYTPKRSSNRKVLLNGGSDLSNTDPYGNDMTADQNAPTVQVYSAGQVPQQVAPAASSVTVQKAPKASSNQPLASGIVKNISIDDQKRFFLSKWFRTLFTGIPYMLDNEVTMFQIFPDYTGTALNTLGNACDQVVVYGRLNHGAISENNDVEVYGKRDANNNIIAKMIRNKASGTTVSPSRTISCLAAWLISLAVIPLAISLFFVIIPFAIIYLILKIKKLFD